MTTVICRKCGGNHFTIKCGKETKTESVLETKLEHRLDNQKSDNQSNHKSEFNSNHKSDNQSNHKSDNQSNQKSEFNSNHISDNQSNHNSNHKQHYKHNEQNYRKNENKFSIKIKDLPNDMTQEEVEELMAEWGQTYRIKVNNYDDCSTVYVDFKYEVEADHFIKALNKTIFDNVIITVEKVI